MDLLRESAEKIRLACEQFAQSEHAKSFDFYQDKALPCMCAIASFALQKYLTSKGFTSMVYVGDYYQGKHGKSKNGLPFGYWSGEEIHCWVECGQFIVDITATQFGVKNKVVIIKDRSRYYTLRKLKTIHGLRGWVDNQKPYVKIIRTILNLAQGPHRC